MEIETCPSRELSLPHMSYLMLTARFLQSKTGLIQLMHCILNTVELDPDTSMLLHLCLERHFHPYANQITWYFNQNLMFSRSNKCLRQMLLSPCFVFAWHLSVASCGGHGIGLNGHGIGLNFVAMFPMIAIGILTAPSKTHITIFWYCAGLEGLHWRSHKKQIWQTSVSQAWRWS